MDVCAQPLRTGGAKKDLGLRERECDVLAECIHGIDQFQRREPVEPLPHLDGPVAALGLSWPVTMEALKARYKQLAKLHHPDANNGDRAAEERLKIINLAYAALRGRIAAAPPMAATG